MIPIIVQARMKSKRLPGKVMLPIYQDRPMLEMQLERLKMVNGVDGIIVATTTDKEDDPIVKLAEKNDCLVFRGSPSNVLERYYEAAKEVHANAIIRITGDCPLIDAGTVARVASDYIAQKVSVNYVSNCWARLYPRGMDVESFSWQALEECYRLSRRNMHGDSGLEQWGGITLTDYDREHVTTFMRRYPMRFRLIDVQPRTAVNQDGTPVSEKSAYRLTVDYQRDFDMVKRIFADMYPSSAYATGMWEPTTKEVDEMKPSSETGEMILTGKKLQVLDQPGDHQLTLTDINHYLDQNPDVAKMNFDIVQRG